MKDSNNKLNIKTIIDAIDSGDPTIYSALLTEDTTFRFGNWEQVKGKSAVFEAQTNFFTSVKSTKHKILKTWENESSIVAEMMVTYIRHDDSTITLPVMDIFEIKNNRITATIIFMDINPLYNPSTD